MLAEGEDGIFELACVGRLSQGLEYLATRIACLVFSTFLPDSYGSIPSSGLPRLAESANHRPSPATTTRRRALGGEDRRAGLPRQGKIDRELLLRSMQLLDRAQALPEQPRYQAIRLRSPGFPTATCCATA